MSYRSRNFWISAAAVVAAAAALPVAIVALVRANDSTANASAGVAASSNSGMGAMSASNMSGGQMSQHIAAAPMKGVPDATATRGGQRLAHTVENGVWVYRLEAKPVRWQILEGTRVTAWTYNGTVPGPEIRVPYGQRVRVVVKNNLPEPTAVHWHGIAVPNAMDGVPGVTQKAIQPGATFTYTFRAIPAGRDSKGGTFLYHSHYDEDRQVGLGLSAPLVIVPPKATRYDVERTLMFTEWNLNSMTGATRPPMDMAGLLPNYFTINGKSYPATEPISVKRGQTVLLRLIGGGQFVHPMHLHGTDFTVVAKDGHPLAQSYAADVIDVAPGERYDIAIKATEPGTWVFHCHIGHHLTNNGTSPGGLLMAIDVGASPKNSNGAAGTSGTGMGSGAHGSMEGGGDMSNMPGMTMTTP
jgi:manganese oxidase